jgi:hypothetical protein
MPMRIARGTGGLVSMIEEVARIGEECGDKSTEPVSYGGVECEAVSVYRRQFERSFRQFVSDWVPGTQFESSQVHHAVFRTCRFPGDGQGARSWRALAAAFRSPRRPFLA